VSTALCGDEELRPQETLLAEAYATAPAPQASLTASRPPTSELAFPLALSLSLRGRGNRLIGTLRSGFADRVAAAHRQIENSIRDYGKIWYVVCMPASM